MRGLRSVWRRLFYDETGSETYESTLVFGVLVLMAVMLTFWIASYVHDKFAELDAAQDAAQRQNIHVKKTPDASVTRKN